MNESVFKSTTETLSRSIANEIAYTYSIFGSDNESRVITRMKSNILLSTRKFLDSETQSIAKDKLIFPHDFLMANIKSHIDIFYSQFNLNCETLITLSHYGERANVFKRQFKENLERSKETTLNAIMRELDLQITQGKAAKSVIRHMQSVISKRTDAVKSLLEDSAGQMKQYMLLWNYQDNGHTHYRFKTNGDNCKACTELDGKVFSIADAEVGVNLAPIHPNCDCTAEVLDENEVEIFTVKSKTEDNEKSSILDYLQTSLNQILLGNYAADTNALGTLGQIAIGLLGLDLPADIRDLVYDITNFKLTPQHALQTILDIVALLPVVGGVKYVDEAGDLVKSAVKHGDEATSLTKNISQHNNAASVANDANKYYTSQTINSLGKKLNIAQFENHSVVTKNPGYKGSPNSSIDIVDENGYIVTRRWYDAQGRAYRDVDFTNHGNPLTHPEWPHEHIWEYSDDGTPIRR
ncbi:MAG: hypothetical protein E7401_00725 [Ruminococcaceae bacterium]|nr:hypothetical protein [Oscillospiraceae bacterium]